MPEPREPRERFEGVLHLFSETGSEGGWYAFQDARFIKRLAEHEKRYVCDRCGVHRDPETNGALRATHSFRISQEMLDGVFAGHGFTPPEECLPAEHEWRALSEESWSYEGLKMLESGDRLTVFDPVSGAPLFSGLVALEQLTPFSHDVSGLWVNQRPQGVPEEDWSRWFLDGYPARLER